MYKNGSMKLPSKLNAVLTLLCLCLLMTVAASAAGPEWQAEGSETAGTVAEATQIQPQPDTQAAPVAPASFTEEQALALVKDSLQADNAWQLIMAGMANHAGAACYRIVAIDPLGDAHSRLVNPGTGEIAVENLWDAAAQRGQQEGEDECPYGQQAEADEQNQDGALDELDAQDKFDEHGNEQESDTGNTGKEALRVAGKAGSFRRPPLDRPLLNVAALSARLQLNAGVFVVPPIADQGRVIPFHGVLHGKDRL